MSFAFGPRILSNEASSSICMAVTSASVAFAADGKTSCPACGPLDLWSGATCPADGDCALAAASLGTSPKARAITTNGKLVEFHLFEVTCYSFPYRGPTRDSPRYWRLPLTSAPTAALHAAPTVHSATETRSSS